MRFTQLFLAIISCLQFASKAQSPSYSVPSMFKELKANSEKGLVLNKNKQDLALVSKNDRFALEQMFGMPSGTVDGIQLDFKDAELNGSVAYGPINENDEFPVVAFLPKTQKIVKGIALLEIRKAIKGANDFYKLTEAGKGLLGYRVMDADGRILYEGRVAFEGKGPYTVQQTIVEGPLINNVTSNSAVLSFARLQAGPVKVLVDGKVLKVDSAQTRHEIELAGLSAASTHTYEIIYNNRKCVRNFNTAPEAGVRKSFSFAFAGANRATTGGGERDFGGTNFQTTRAIMAFANMQGAAFMQSTGDITNGGNSSESAHLLEYANWKRAMDPFWSSMPVYTGFGDHEVNYFIFAADTVTKKGTKIDRFPYATMSGEASFAAAFVHPLNGPSSEDGASYDPDPKVVDFPTYSENVYYYTYDNVAMIVLNTEYWKAQDPMVTGCPEGYLMDQQMKWLEKTMQTLEADPNIDHIFVNVHSAVFPNGDHANGAMWYLGNNAERPKVGGQRVSKGILERRDELLELCVNKSKKFLAFLSADEHNFAFLKIENDFPLYPANYTLPKIKLNRPFYHINNGGGGSASYAMLETPWSNKFQYFSAPPILAMMQVQGQTVKLKVFNVETMQVICNELKLK